METQLKGVIVVDILCDPVNSIAVRSNVGLVSSDLGAGVSD